MDLVRAAKEAQAQPDPDIALHNFLSACPPARCSGPRLDLSPRRLMLGAMRAGETAAGPLTVTNQGKGLLQGKVTVSEGEDVAEDRRGVRRPSASCRSRRPAIRKSRSASSRAACRPADLQRQADRHHQRRHRRGAGAPRPGGRCRSRKPPFQGAATPARAGRAHARATPSRRCRCWRTARWPAGSRPTAGAYPVAGPPARGVAAVQQFFEGMGLSKPPPLELSENEFRFQCDAAGDRSAAR